MMVIFPLRQFSCVSRRLLGTNVRRLSDLVTVKCPPPRYDTGCTFCQVDLPADKPINYEHNLNGTAAVPWKHVLVLSHGVTNFDDMASKINLIPGSLAEKFEFVKRKMLSPAHPVTLSNASILGHSVAGEKHRVRIYPDNLEVEFESEQLEDFVQAYLVPEEKVEVYNPFTSTKKDTEKKMEKNKTETRADPQTLRKLFSEKKIDKDLVLICAHTKRDIRCGLLAAPLEAEFSQVLEKEGLSSHVEVGRISHIGGHVYAGNVIYFPRDTKKPVVWYGRVFPANVQGIVGETIEKGAIIQELLRGKSHVEK